MDTPKGGRKPARGPIAPVPFEEVVRRMLNTPPPSTAKRNAKAKRKK
jgi:hypothetical protein